MVITKDIEFDMGHRVPNHKSKCSNPHGHRYKIEVAVDGAVIQKPGDSSEGMVIDFGDLKQILMDYVDSRLDHGYMIYKGDEFLPLFIEMQKTGKKIIIVNFVPTAENIAEFIYDLIKGPLLDKDIRLKHVRIWETPTSTAIYGVT